MVLSGAEYSMAVMAAFPFWHHTIRGPFSINADILGFSENCSYSVLALSFKRASRCREQSHHRLYLKVTWTFSIYPRLYPTSAQALGPKVNWARVTISMVP